MRLTNFSDKKHFSNYINNKMNNQKKGNKNNQLCVLFIEILIKVTETRSNDSIVNCAERVSNTCASGTDQE